MTNYPAGLTQGQHDRIFADDPNESRYGHSKAIDPLQVAEGWICSADCWNENVALNEDESIPNLPSTPCTRCGYARGAHGMISTVCPDGKGLLDESIPARPTLQIVKGGRA